MYLSNVYLLLIILGINLIIVLDTSGSAYDEAPEAKAFIKKILQHYNTDPNNVYVALFTTNNCPSRLEWDFIKINTALNLVDSIAYSGGGCNLREDTYENVSSIICQNNLPSVVISVADELTALHTDLKDSVPSLQNQAAL